MFQSIGSFIEWYGAVAVLVAYGLAIFGVIPFMGGVFAILNMAGAAVVLIGSMFGRNFQWSIFYLLWGALTALVYFKVF